MATRRELDLCDLDAAVRDTQSLHAVGYLYAGQWDLGQVCGHLADWMRFPLDGFPMPPPPIGLMLWTMRHTVGRRWLGKTLQWIESLCAVESSVANSRACA